jgi:hypothetical protein
VEMAVMAEVAGWRSGVKMNEKKLHTTPVTL